MSYANHYNMGSISIQSTEEISNRYNYQVSNKESEVMSEKLFFSKFPNTSSIKTNEKTETSIRKDKFGNPISRNNKSHKICFADELPNGGKLSQVNKVMSLKTFNLEFSQLIIHL